MESLYLLIPLSVIAAFAAGWVLWRAVDGGQFDDLEGPAHRILQDDDGVAAAPVHSLASSGAGFKATADAKHDAF